MESLERRPDEPEPDRTPDAGPTGERVYDSFVVRLWREVGNRLLLRVEVQHAQSGDVANARGVDVAWIGTRIADLLGESRAPPAARGHQRPFDVSSRRTRR